MKYNSHSSSPQGSPRRSGSPHVSSSPSRAQAGSPSVTGQGGEGVKVAFNIGATNKEETAGRFVINFLYQKQEST